MVYKWQVSIVAGTFFGKIQEAETKHYQVNVKKIVSVDNTFEMDERELVISAMADEDFVICDTNDTKYITKILNLVAKKQAPYKLLELWTYKDREVYLLWKMPKNKLSFRS